MGVELCPCVTSTRSVRDNFIHFVNVDDFLYYVHEQAGYLHESQLLTLYMNEKESQVNSLGRSNDTFICNNPKCDNQKLQS